KSKLFYQHYLTNNLYFYFIYSKINTSLILSSCANKSTLMNKKIAPTGIGAILFCHFHIYSFYLRRLYHRIFLITML
ncbi:hypothetical protein, partial [Fusobacterium polymorphum]|uniref:hypothetical protein n=1 Tax=Fusobacterium nucleatum subsp. polymorphum TaxID=76857 RepID=UPI001C9CE4D3